ncbi:hypothetical protein HZA96_04065 [Candidatus Woesearchaeota archaeon]|nr:hypothetical protein [Candidatus Woesearchaeota archaeon]
MATKIIEIISKEEWGYLISKYKNNIVISPHALYRLSEMQRKIYKEDYLIYLLTKESPHLIGIQENKNYAVFYKRNYGYIRMIISVKTECIEIITFFITEHLPRI